MKQKQLTLATASRVATSSANRTAGFSEGLNTGLALTGGGGSLVLGTRGLLSELALLLLTRCPIRLLS